MDTARVWFEIVLFAVAWQACRAALQTADSANMFLIVVGGNAQYTGVDILDLKTNIRYAGTSAPKGITYSGGELTNGTIYTVGSAASSDQFTAYNLLTDSWKELSSLTASSFSVSDWRHSSLAAFGTSLITLGGYSATGSPVYKYEKFQWSKLTYNYPSTCSGTFFGARAVVVSRATTSSIYVTGGLCDNHLTGVYRMDSVLNSWTYVNDLKAARRFHEAVTFEGIIYVLGGYNGGTLNSVEAFKVDSSSGWQNWAPMIHTRQAFGAVVIPSTRTILACGGQSSDPSGCETLAIDQGINGKWTAAGIGLKSSNYGFNMFFTDVVPAAVTRYQAPIRLNQEFCAYPDLSYQSLETGTTGCYRAFSAKLDWPHARVACQMWGGHLVTISAADENAWVVNLTMSAGISDRAWLGMHSYEKFLWNAGITSQNPLVPGDNILTQLPGRNNTYPLHCVYLSVSAASRGSWFSQECWSNYSFVCEKTYKAVDKQAAQTTTTEAPTTTACAPFGLGATCPESLKRYGIVQPDRGTCLILGGTTPNTTTLSWKDANTMCKSIPNGILVDVNDASKWQAVNNLAAIALVTGQDGAWVGLQNFYRWTDGNMLLYIPNHSSLTRSVGMCYAFSNLTNDYNSSDCSDLTVQLPYICQVVGCPLGMTSVSDCSNTNYICVEENECFSGKADCGTSSAAGTCINLPHNQGQYRCDCQPGFQRANKSNPQSACVDIRECDDNNTCLQQLQGGVCIEQYGGYLCACKNGYRVQSMSTATLPSMAKQTCIDVNECTELNNPCGNGTCTNFAGGYSCACNPGFQVSNGRCIDINECALSLYPCGIPTSEAICNNIVGYTSAAPRGFTCDCPRGYKFMTERNSTCVQIDNCRPDSGAAPCGTDPQVRCLNFQKTFYCACAAGYYWDSLTLKCQSFNYGHLSYSNGSVALSGNAVFRQ